MSTSPQPTHFCEYESDDFPATDFTPDPTWGLVHATATPLHNARGTPLTYEHGLLVRADKVTIEDTVAEEE